MATRVGAAPLRCFRLRRHSLIYRYSLICRSRDPRRTLPRPRPADRRARPAGTGGVHRPGATGGRLAALHARRRRVAQRRPQGRHRARRLVRPGRSRRGRPVARRRLSRSLRQRRSPPRAARRRRLRRSRFHPRRPHWRLAQGGRPAAFPLLPRQAARCRPVGRADARRRLPQRRSQRRPLDRRKAPLRGGLDRSVQLTGE
jgi:hypothetical protein